MFRIPTCKHEYKIEAKEVLTNHLGYEQITGFYSFAKKLTYTSINLNIWGVEMLDANLAGLIIALIRKLRIENKLYIYSEIPNHMNVLFRNGFFNKLIDIEEDNYDDRDSTIPLTIFHPEADEDFLV